MTVGALLALALVATACTKSDQQVAQAKSGDATPQKGGTLTIGMSGGTDSDTLDGQQGLQPTDWARAYALFDPLVKLDNNGQPQLWMATEIQPNATATEYTIKIPANIVTHQGKAFTAADVLHSLKRIVDVKSPAANTIGPIDFADSKVVNDTTLDLKYKSPFSTLVAGLSQYEAVMVPRGFNPKDPDGTGPFVYQSFTPGQSSTFTAFAHYWRKGPYVNKLVIQNVNDEQSQLAALQSGQVDVINNVSPATEASLKSSGGGYSTYESTGGSCMLITMDTAQAPFNDPDVRQAFKLLVNRKQMLQALFGGKGTLGNDHFGWTDPATDTSLPQREQDVAQAKQLLAKAGDSNLKINLVTAPFGPYITSAAQVFATQAKAAGVNVNVQVESSTDYFAKSWGHVSLSQDFYGADPYLLQVSLALVPGAPYNTTHFNDPEFNALYKQAISTTDQTKQANIIRQMEKIEYDRGSEIIPICYPSIDASTSKVHGIEATKSGLNPSAMDFADMWIG